MSITTEARRREIAAAVHENGRVRVAELARRYGISEVSVRNDLAALEAEGHLNRVHGGAVDASKMYANMDLGERYMTNAVSKKRLAEKIASLIEDNDTIMMNAGTTLTYVLRALQGKKNISIVTNSIQNALEANAAGCFDVTLLGGQIDAKYQFTFGVDTLAQLEKYHVTKSILSVDGIHPVAGLTLYYSNESNIVKKMIDSSDTVIVAADGSKLGKTTFSRVAPLSDVDILVTSASDKRAEVEAIGEAGIKVYEA